MALLEFPGKRKMLGLAGPRWSKVSVSHAGVTFHSAAEKEVFLWGELTANTIRTPYEDSATDDWHMEFASGTRVCRLDYEDLDDDHVRRLIELVKVRIPNASHLEMDASITGEYEGPAKAARQFLKKQQFKQAEMVLEKGLARCESKFGPDDPYVAFMLETYAILLTRTGREEKAREVRQRSKAIRANPWKFF